MRSKKLLIAMLLMGLYISLSPLVAMADPNVSPSPQKPECNPRAIVLAGWMGVKCQDLMVMQQAEGIGFGVMMKAYSITKAYPLSQMFADDALDWQDLARSHVSADGLGWGQIMKAQLLARRLGVEAGELLGERGKGMGWGQILKKHGKAPGPPPWARPNHNERT